MENNISKNLVQNEAMSYEHKLKKDKILRKKL